MPRPDLTISIPASWRRTSDPTCGVLVSARSPMLSAGGVRPGVRLCCEPAPDDAARWAAETRAELAERLDGFDVEDEDVYEIGGRRAAYRRYAHRVRGVDVLCDEWSWLVDGLGFVLTGTVAREDYPEFCEVFEAVAETFDPLPP